MAQAKETAEAKLKPITQKVLDEYMKAMPKSLQEHGERCYQLAEEYLKLCEKDDWYQFHKVNSKHLANAVYYHDIGKSKLKGYIVFRFACKNQREVEEYESHIEKGLDILEEYISFDGIEKRSSFDKYIYLAIRDHHERFDGGGVNGSKQSAISFIGQFTHFIDFIDNKVFMSKAEDFLFQDAIKEFKESAGSVYSRDFVKNISTHLVEFKKFAKELFDSMNRKESTKSIGIKTFFNLIENTGTKDPFGYKFDYFINNSYFSQIESRQIRNSIENHQVSLKLSNFLLNKLTDAFSELTMEQLEFPLTFIQLSKYTLESKDFPNRITKLCNKESIPHEKIVIIVNLTSEVDLGLKLSKAIKALKENGFKLALNGIGNKTVPVDILNNMEPEYIFIDSDQMAEANRSARKFSVFSGILEIIKSVGSTIIADDIDNETLRDQLFTLGIRIQSGKIYKNQISTNELIRDIRGE